MVTIMGNKFWVRTSVSVLAMVVSVTMALAEDTQTTASTEGNLTDMAPKVIVCEFFPGAVEMDGGTKVDDGDSAVAVDDGGEGGPDVTADPIPGDGGAELPVYFSTTDMPTTPEMVQRDKVLTLRHVAGDSGTRDPAAVPDLCDIAGPGLDWLCGTKTR